MSSSEVSLQLVAFMVSLQFVSRPKEKEAPFPQGHVLGGSFPRSDDTCSMHEIHSEGAMQSGEVPTKEIVNRAFPTRQSIQSALAQIQGGDNNHYHYLRFGRSSGKIPILSDFLVRPGKRAEWNKFLTRPARGGGSMSDFLTRPGKRGSTSDFLFRPTRNDNSRQIRRDWSNFLSRPTKRQGMGSFLVRPTRAETASFLPGPIGTGIEDYQMVEFPNDEYESA
eukprot:maker-scaffold417_size177606-snap-gene-0.59 protein:Tk07611 transcript:maker-scaffold417_size177606-snap-gene-0.59-mRNA-1 annotation:"glutamate receptor delta-1-like"